ncbi:hypothetical protein [Frondihabitans cladoniiphilus]|uniref:Uncharacterized protein n=1 Tax=Frondihabitans cladoniiphilus TaxID=715785 RepID=A0ABP8VRZ6_9MICO
MNTTPERGMHGLPSGLRGLAADAYLWVVAPTGFRGGARLIGLGLVAEGLFLAVVSAAVPVGNLALLSVLVGEGAFVASFVPGRAPRG